MNNYWKYHILFLLPALFFFIMTVYYPLFYTILLSFTHSTGFEKTMADIKFGGLDNYISIFTNPDYIKPFMNTIKFALFTTIVVNVLQFTLALILDHDLKTKNFLRASFYIPALLSGTVISGIFTNMLQYRGVMNTILTQIGLEFWVNDWFGNMGTALEMLMSIQVWQYLGFGAVVYLAGLQSIPVDYYEAATIDGANFLAKLKAITFPLMMPVITVITFFAIVGGLKIFDLPFIITKGGPAGATETISTYIYKLNSVNRVGLACAIGVVMLLLISMITCIQLFFTRKREVEL